MIYIIEIIDIESGEAYHFGPYTFKEAVDHCIDGQRETGDDYTHEMYTIH